MNMVPQKPQTEKALSILKIIENARAQKIRIPAQILVQERIARSYLGLEEVTNTSLGFASAAHIA